MRVRISYSVELDKVTEECERMLTKCSAELVQVAEKINVFCDDLKKGNIPAYRVGEFLKECRQDLVKADSVLMDNDAILDGFFKTIESQNSKESEDVAEEG